jgi:hypothetical protein
MIGHIIVPLLLLFIICIFFIIQGYKENYNKDIQTKYYIYEIHLDNIHLFCILYMFFLLSLKSILLKRVIFFYSCNIFIDK